MNVDLSRDEIVALIESLDLAVRTNGMRAAVVALPIAAKLDAAALRGEDKSAKPAPVTAVGTMDMSDA